MNNETLTIIVLLAIVFGGLYLYAFLNHTGPFADTSYIVFNGSMGLVEYYSGSGNCGCPQTFYLNGSYKPNWGCVC